MLVTARLGNGASSGNYNTPQAVSTENDYNGTNAVMVACGGEHSLILLNTREKFFLLEMAGMTVRNWYHRRLGFIYRDTHRRTV